MFKQLFIWRHIVNAFVGLDRVVEVDETQQTNLSIFPVLKCLLLVPHLHDGTDHAFGFAVGLRSIDSRELLTNAQLGSGFHKSVFVVAFELFAVV
jgi:hypothetical protein